MGIDEKLEELKKEIKEGHASLHQRHDRADQEMGYLHYKVDRIRLFLRGVWRALVDVFIKDRKK